MKRKLLMGLGERAARVALWCKSRLYPLSTVSTDESGRLVCEHCGSDEIEEFGKTFVYWPYGEQRVAEKELVLPCGFEWSVSEGEGFQCHSCGSTWDQLPEGWEAVYG